MNQLSGVKKKDELIFIQKTLKKITNQDLDIEYIEKNYLKILFKLKSKNKIMIAGSQGSGKSSLSKLIKLYLEKFCYKSVVIISMDDFYLSKSQRTQLSKNIHPLFLTRGVPGTHDLELMNKKIKQILNKEFPIYLPIFDKVSDSRKRTYKKILKADVVIFEGWCAGSQPVDQNYLQKNFNNLEKHKDKNFIWRNSYNKYLNEYQKLFSQFNFFIYFQFNQWDHVLNWKYKQELELRDKKKDLGLKKYLREFIQYYEKVSKWMHLKVPKYCNILIKLDAHQKIKSINLR
ncbi:MAG: zeta toxin family protein [Alphaproteobacteria bacterium]|jgi:D-glycerate 3-kinase